MAESLKKLIRHKTNSLVVLERKICILLASRLTNIFPLSVQPQLGRQHCLPELQIFKPWPGHKQS